jgi:hypothetical protein
MLRSRAQAVPFYGNIGAGSISANSSPRAIRPSMGMKLPPSSFRDMSSSSSSPAPRTPSRPSSRISDFGGSVSSSAYLYKPGNPRDPLDAEVAAIVNSIAHGLLIERVDPPLKVMPREGEEIRAQYAFSNSLARKTVTCRLTTLSRAGAKGEASTATKKVMVRVGGGECRVPVPFSCAANGADFWDDRVAGSAVVHAEPRSRDVIERLL